jgi:hypothetical protein
MWYTYCRRDGETAKRIVPQDICSGVIHNQIRSELIQSTFQMPATNGTELLKRKYQVL